MFVNRPIEKSEVQEAVIRKERQALSSTVLLVEDQREIAEIYKVALSNQGYRVLSINHGSEALELIENHSEEIDILVCDIVLPGVSGISLAHKLKNRRPDSRILLMTGYSELQADDIGFPVLGKPFTPRQLLAEIEKI
jgi:DNA-binding response OmpR family regulator